MTRIWRICADQIRLNLLNPRYPRSIETGHAVNEQLAMTDLMAAVQGYCGVVEAVLAG